MSQGAQRSQAQGTLPLEVSARCVLVPLETVRIQRGCDAESVLRTVGDATHPRFLRWVFNLGVNRLGDIRELRFWKDEVAGIADPWAEPETAIELILGKRETFPRGEIEVAWTINATTIGRLIRAGELEESNHKLTRASLAAFLKRRLQ